MLVTVNVDHDGGSDLGTCRNGDDLCASESIPRDNRRTIAGGKNISQTRIITSNLFNSHFSRCVHLQAQGLRLKEAGIKKFFNSAKRGKTPVLFTPVRGRNLFKRERSGAIASGRMCYGCSRSVRMRTGSGLLGRHQPTDPSICNSMSRFNSRAYSMGSSLAIGSTKPRTIVAIASFSSKPRLIK